MDRPMGRLTLTTLLVLVLAAILARPVAAGYRPAPARQDGGFCDEMGAWCSIQPDGTMHCEESDRCESEGDEDDGDYKCTPGHQYAIRICQENGLYECVYVCTEDQTWQDAGCAMVVPECDHDEWCYWDIENDTGGCWELPGNETPCEDMDWGTAGIQCLGEYALNVSVTVPCQRVGRIPYPRGMVIVPNRMWIAAGSPAWVESWSQTLDYNACLSQSIEDGDRAVRNYRIGLAWGRIDSMPPYWEVEDSGVYQGWSVGGVVWERSSWGHPRCGPGLGQGERLPAYRVDVYTYWQAYWRRVYERQRETWECVWQQDAHDDGVCECVPEGHTGSCSDDNDGDGVSDWAGWVAERVLCDTDANGDGVPDDECWETVDSGWNVFDLRTFGYPTAYFVSTAAGPVPTALEPDPDCSGICVPVIEVQSVIRNVRGR
ncbi:MAG TPA: hypothetical protein ENI39_04760 [Anaerolineae bacterium]|nr:hypothetical protein [Anaerolineae bacterium]